MWGRLGRLVAGQLLALIGIVLMAVTVIGLPFAAWKLIGWLFVQQEILIGDSPVRGSLQGSSDLVRGRWWHAVRPLLFILVLGTVAGPMVAFALIFTTIPLTLINLIGSLIFALLIPYFAILLTLLYFDLGVRAEEEPAKPGREWPRFWKKVRRPRPPPRPAPSPPRAASRAR